jgi:MraZ protein
MGNLLIGSYRAKLDKSGRLKVPERFRTAIEERWGQDLFVTSLEDSFIKVFPLPVWLAMTGSAESSNLFLDPDIEEYMRRANSFGGQAELDAKGRVLVSPALRTMAGLATEVVVIGLNNHLEVWDTARLDEKLQRKPLSRDDFKKIAELMTGRKGS